MRYQDAIHFIYNLELFGIKMGLENISRLLQRLDNPQNSYQTIHIAGTNGKGSVASMLFSILTAAGYNTGVFTSPHLVDYRERFRTSEGHIDKRSITQFVSQNIDFIREAKITFFEIATALAFWYFRKKQVDIAIIEVGLGGRLDATNILKPLLSVITEIDLDHTKILGNTLQKIAVEKAGIIKHNIPVVTNVQNRDICQLLKQICQERETNLYRTPTAGKKFSYQKEMMNFEINRNGQNNLRAVSALVGTHQIRNSTLAAHCVKLLNKQGLKIPDSALKRGLRNTSWSSRFQIVCKKPTIILDVAHNPSAAMRLAESFKIAYPQRKFILVGGFLERPDYDVILKTLKPLTKRAIITRPDYRRAAEIEGVIWAAVNADIDFDVRLEVAVAVDRALQLASIDDIILICGSHFTVGQAIIRLEQIARKGKLANLSADITYING